METSAHPNVVVLHADPDSTDGKWRLKWIGPDLEWDSKYASGSASDSKNDFGWWLAGEGPVWSGEVPKEGSKRTVITTVPLADIKVGDKVVVKKEGTYGLITNEQPDGTDKYAMVEVTGFAPGGAAHGVYYVDPWSGTNISPDSAVAMVAKVEGEENGFADTLKPGHFERKHELKSGNLIHAYNGAFETDPGDKPNAMVVSTNGDETTFQMMETSGGLNGGRTYNFINIPSLSEGIPVWVAGEAPVVELGHTVMKDVADIKVGDHIAVSQNGTLVSQDPSSPMNAVITAITGPYSDGDMYAHWELDNGTTYTDYLWHNHQYPVASGEGPVPVSGSTTKLVSDLVPGDQIHIDMKSGSLEPVGGDHPNVTVLSGHKEGNSNLLSFQWIGPDEEWNDDGDVSKDKDDFEWYLTSDYALSVWHPGGEQAVTTPEVPGAGHWNTVPAARLKPGDKVYINYGDGDWNVKEGEGPNAVVVSVADGFEDLNGPATVAWIADNNYGSAGEHLTWYATTDGAANGIPVWKKTQAAPSATANTEPVVVPASFILPGDTVKVIPGQGELVHTEYDLASNIDGAPIDKVVDHVAGPDEDGDYKLYFAEPISLNEPYDWAFGNKSYEIVKGPESVTEEPSPSGYVPIKSVIVKQFKPGDRICIYDTGEIGNILPDMGQFDNATVTSVSKHFGADGIDSVTINWETDDGKFGQQTLSDSNGSSTNYYKIKPAAAPVEGIDKPESHLEAKKKVAEPPDIPLGEMAPAPLADSTTAQVGVKVQHITKGKLGTIQAIPDQKKYPGMVWVIFADNPKKPILTGLSKLKEPGSHFAELQDKNGKVLVIGQVVQAAGQFSGKVTSIHGDQVGTIVSISPAKDQVQIELASATDKYPAGKKLWKKVSKITVLKDPVTGNEGVAQVASEVTEVAEVVNYDEPDIPVVPMQSGEFKDKWLSGAPQSSWEEGVGERKLMADGNVPYVGMPVVDKKGNKYIVVSWGQGVTTKNNIKLLPIAGQTSVYQATFVNRKVNTLSADLDSPVFKAPTASKLYVHPYSTEYKYQAGKQNQILKAGNPLTIDLKDGETLYRVTSEKSPGQVGYYIVRPGFNSNVGFISTWVSGWGSEPKDQLPKLLPSVARASGQHVQIVAKGASDSENALTFVSGGAWSVENTDFPGFKPGPPVLMKVADLDSGVPPEVLMAKVKGAKPLGEGEAVTPDTINPPMDNKTLPATQVVEGSLISINGLKYNVDATEWDVDKGIRFKVTEADTNKESGWTVWFKELEPVEVLASPAGAPKIPNPNPKPVGIKSVIGQVTYADVKAGDYVSLSVTSPDQFKVLAAETFDDGSIQLKVLNESTETWHWADTHNPTDPIDLLEGSAPGPPPTNKPTNLAETVAPAAPPIIAQPLPGEATGLDPLPVNSADAPVLISPMGTIQPPPKPAQVKGPAPAYPPADLPKLTGDSGSFEHVPEIPHAHSVFGSAHFVLSHKKDKEQGTGASFSITDGSALEDQAIRFQVVVGSDGKEYLEAKVKLTQGQADKIGMNLVMEEGGQKTTGAWVQDDMNVKDLVDGDLISVYAGHSNKVYGQEVSVLKPRSDPSPNVRVVGKPTYLGKPSGSGGTSDVDVWRVSVVDAQGNIGQVDIEDRGTMGDFPKYHYDWNKVVHTGGKNIVVHPDAAAQGWVRTGSTGQLSMSGSWDAYGRKVYTDPWTGVPNTGSAAGGSTLVREFEDGSNLSFTYAMTSEADTTLNSSNSSVQGPRHGNLVNNVFIRIPVDQAADRDEFTKTLTRGLEAVGVSVEAQRPPTEQEVRKMAINKVAQLIAQPWHPGVSTNGSGYDGDPDTETILADLAKQIHINRKLTMSDVVTYSEPDGRIWIGFNDEVADHIRKAQNNGDGITHFQHSIYGGEEGALSILGGPHNGLLASEERWSRGGTNFHGASSSSDVLAGCGDRLYLHSRGGSIQQGDWTLIYSARAVDRTTEVYPGMSSDSWGTHKANWVKLQSGSEAMYKRTMPPDMLAYVTAPSEGARQSLIDSLHARGITTYGGRPLEEVIIVNTYIDVNSEEFQALGTEALGILPLNELGLVPA